MPTITILPASTNAGKETIQHLLSSSSSDSNQPLTIRAIYRTPSKAPSSFTSHPNFLALPSDVSEPSTLDFSQTDTLFYIPPPTYDGTDTAEWAARTANNVRDAILRSGGRVKRLLIFSAIGSQHDKDIGILKLNHITDDILIKLQGSGVVDDVVVVRPGYFMELWGEMLKSAVQEGVVRPWITPAEHAVPMISLKDIAAVCGAELVKPISTADRNGGEGPRFLKLFGPRHYSSLDLKNAIGEVIGKEVKMEAPERDQLVEFFSYVVPPTYAQEFADMTTAVMPGGIMEGDFDYDEKTIRGKVELVDALREVYEGMKTKE